MSILNSRFTDAEMMEGAIKESNAFVEQVLEKTGLDERQQSILELLGEGLSLGDIMGIKKEHRDVLINQAAIFIQAGELDKARDILGQIIQFEPTEERALYLSGIVFQLQSDLERAAFCYLQFLALDATNPEGYLRLGECLMSAGEYENARHALDSALEFAREGKGRPGNAEQAENLLAIISSAA
jgi:tetratricopeptide (TPR) repeat protein